MFNAQLSLLGMPLIWAWKLNFIQLHRNLLNLKISEICWLRESENEISISAWVVKLFWFHAKDSPSCAKIFTSTDFKAGKVVMKAQKVFNFNFQRWIN